MFNYFRKYICVEEVFIQHTKTISLKIEKKTSIEAQSEGRALVNLHKTSESCSVGSERFRRLQFSYT